MRVFRVFGLAALALGLVAATWILTDPARRQPPGQPTGRPVVFRPIVATVLPPCVEYAQQSYALSLVVVGVPVWSPPYSASATLDVFDGRLAPEATNLPKSRP
jgi:hypothetical protein